MEIRYIDVDISLKKWTGEEDGQNVYQNLFTRKFRIAADFPMNLDTETFRRFLHDRVDTMLDELKKYMEVQ